jgi:uncharacterized membrane protein
MARLRTTDLSGVALAVAAAAVGVVFWRELPAEMAVHFDVGGAPDGYVPKPVAVFALPLLTVALLGFVNLVARYDPPTAPRVLTVSKLWTAALLAYVQTFVVVWNLGYTLSVDLVLAPVLVSAVILVLWSVAAERQAALG